MPIGKNATKVQMPTDIRDITIANTASAAETVMNVHTPAAAEKITEKSITERRGISAYVEVY